jgi:hypothetical protein
MHTGLPRALACHYVYAGPHGPHDGPRLVLPELVPELLEQQPLARSNANKERPGA